MLPDPADGGPRPRSEPLGGQVALASPHPSADGAQVPAHPPPAERWEVRPAAEVSTASLVDLLARCSSQARFDRFLGHVERWPPAYLEAVQAGRDDHPAVVAVIGDRTIGLASL